MPPTPPRDYDYEQAARALNEAGRTDTGTSVLDLANTALQTTGAIANAGAAVAPLLGNLMQAAPPALMLGGRVALSTARLGASMTSSASRGVANAMSNLVQAGMPVSHRGHDHLERHGIRVNAPSLIAQGLSHFVQSHRHLG